MKILIFIGSTVTGVDNQAGSEQRYLFGIAEMLAHYGHEVDCVGSDDSGNDKPKWGDTVPIPGITLKHMSSIDRTKETYDLAIVSENIVHWRSPGKAHQTPCTEFDNIAPVIGHTLFGWAGTGLPCAMKENTGKKHWVIQPWEPPHRQPNDVIVYYPVFKELAPADLSHRDSIIIAAKDPFIDEWPEDKIFHFGALSAMRAMKQLSDKRKVRSVFVPSRSYASAKRAERLGATKIFNEISYKQTYETLVRRSVIETEMKRSRVSIMLHGYFSSAFIAPAMGAVPIYFTNDTGTCWHPKQKLLDMSKSDDEIYLGLERFFTDDEFYLTQLNESRENIKRFSWASAYESFLKFMKEKR